MKVRLVVALLILALAVVSVLSFFHLRLSRPAAQQTALSELSYEEYTQVREGLLSILRREDARAALDELRERIKTNGALSRSCHALVHAIGHEAYEKYGNFGEAMRYQDELCNSGYLHGIIEEYFKDSPDVFAAMQAVCGRYPLGSFIGWECYHGVGHGLMYYTEDDLPRSLELCDSYGSSFARNSCANGVFMENFNSDQKIHVSEYLDPADPFYPCPTQTDVRKQNCYSYAPAYYLSLHKQAYAEALGWCERAEPHYQRTCSTGVGAQAVKENINDPKLVESVCSGAPVGLGTSCIEGMINLYIVHFGSLEQAKDLCGRLDPWNRAACRSTISRNKGLFSSG